MFLVIYIFGYFPLSLFKINMKGIKKENYFFEAHIIIYPFPVPFSVVAIALFIYFTSVPDKDVA